MYFFFLNLEINRCFYCKRNIVVLISKVTAYLLSETISMYMYLF